MLLKIFQICTPWAVGFTFEFSISFTCLFSVNTFHRYHPNHLFRLCTSYLSSNKPFYCSKTDILKFFKFAPHGLQASLLSSRYLSPVYFRQYFSQAIQTIYLAFVHPNFHLINPFIAQKETFSNFSNLHPMDCRLHF